MTLARSLLGSLPRPGPRASPRDPLPAELHGRFSHREIVEAVFMARLDLEIFAAAGLRRKEWHHFIGARPAIDPGDDVTTLTIWTLERGLLERQLAQEKMPPAASLSSRKIRRRRQAPSP